MLVAVFTHAISDVVAKQRWFWKTAVVQTKPTKCNVDTLLGGRKGGCLVCKACTYGFPNPFPRNLNFIFIHLQNDVSQYAILAFFKVFKPAKCICFLVFQLSIRRKTDLKRCILHRFASLDCLHCVFCELFFCQLFHPFHSIQRFFACPE